jgi:hypothetical protein
MFDPRGGFISSPVHEDHPTARKLWGIFRTGTKKDRNWRTDAHHLTHAIEHGLEVFLTLDRKTIVSRRAEIQTEFPKIRVLLPSELCAEMDAGAAS